MELWHVLNRGVEKRNIFMSEKDYVRFVHDLYEFNDTKPANNTSYFLAATYNDVGRRYMGKDERDRLIDLHGWCLMRNHYHLLLSGRRDGGITSFLRKLNGGYTKYVNEKYKRSGVLFQGKTKKKLIKNDGHFLHILHYIHLNPLDYLKGASGWRAHNVSNGETALEYLDSYRWSSYPDYCATPNFPSLIEKTLFGDVFKDYKKEIAHYLRDISPQRPKAPDVTLE